MTKETFEDGDTATYTYDNNGVLSKVTDSATGITTTYYYDSTERLMKYVEKGEDHNFTVGYQYDTRNNLTRLVETINGVEHTSDYTYDADNRITDITNGASAIHHEYDGFGRMYETQTKHNGNTILTQSATYKSPAAGKTGLQVETYTIDSNGYDITYTYTYDARGNISSISDGTNTTTYFYDSADQLIRENNQAGGYTNSWEYDDAGNIICYRKYPYMTDNLQNYEGLYLDEVYYSYNDSQWGDLLTGYDGRTVTSDEIGNMTSDGTWTYNWEHGRQLKSVNRFSFFVSYTYDANGMRTSQNVDDGVITTYVYEGDRLVQLNKYGEDCYFTYDANGNPATMTYCGSTYYYVVNLQGDVIGILNSRGELAVYYVYDAWGNVIQSGGEYYDPIGYYNPFGYRGYIYDDVTGLYYVSSRYYDPEIGRWISPEPNVYNGEFDEGAGLIGYNVYAYCANNPVNNIDPTGEFVISTAVLIGIGIGALIGGTVGGVYGYKKAVKNNVAKQDRWKYVVGYGLGGAVVGGVIGGFVGYGAGVALGAKASSGLVVKSISKALSSVSRNTMHHIMQSKHAWGQVLKRATWNNVKSLINTTMQKGATTLINKQGNALIYEAVRNNIVVRYAVIDGIIKISDAWVKTR